MALINGPIVVRGSDDKKINTGPVVVRSNDAGSPVQSPAVKQSVSNIISHGNGGIRKSIGGVNSSPGNNDALKNILSFDKAKTNPYEGVPISLGIGPRRADSVGKSTGVVWPEKTLGSSGAGNGSGGSGIVNSNQNIFSGDRVSARDFAQENGADVSWDDASGSLLINGHVVPKDKVYIENGRSFVDRDVLNNILDYSKKYTPGGNLIMPGEKSVRVVDYVKNLPGAEATYSESSGDVFLNGIRIPKEYVHIDSDGRSYVDEGILKSIYERSAEGNDDSFFNAKKRITDADELLSKLYKEVSEPKEFEYDYRTDPSFKAFSDYYDQLADQAVSDAIAQMVGRTGGYLNSNALAAAYQARNLYNQQKANIIPTLEKQAFERYLSGRELNATQMQALGNVLDSFNNTYLNARNNELSLNHQIENDKNSLNEDSRQFDTQIDLANRELELDEYVKNRQLDEEIRQFDKSFDLDLATIFANLRKAGYTDDVILQILKEHLGDISFEDIQKSNYVTGGGSKTVSTSKAKSSAKTNNSNKTNNSGNKGAVDATLIPV